ncbi:MAG: TniQ family protein [Clostridia bacterium]|nr:TniQ family protein [Clostridia bacterium]
MPKLPFVSVPLPDELLYSYLLRLSIANGFDDIRDFTDHYVFPIGENEKRTSTKISYEAQDDLYRFAASVWDTDPNQTLSFYLKTSLFHGIAPLCSSYRTSCYVGSLSKYRNPSKLLSPTHVMISELRFCPLCQKDDLDRHGYFYYHRAHQMPGVTVCHKHGCALHVYEGRHGEEMKLPLISNSLPFHTKSHEYAIFCKAFLEAELECDLTAITDAILKKFCELGYSPEGHSLTEQMKDYGELMKDTPEKILRSIRNSACPHMASLLTLLLYLFHDVSGLKPYLKPKLEIRQPFEEAIANKYTLVAPFREDIVELQCKECGECFLSTPDRILSGWGCPSCDGKMDDATLFRRLFEARVGETFELLSDFQSKSHPIRVRHLSCGKEFDTSVQSCLKRRLKCRCEYTLIEKTVREKVENLGGFELLAFKTSMQPILLRHKACGNTFRVMYHPFVKDPRCSICQRLRNNRHLPNEETKQKFSDLVGDEYKLLNIPESAKKRILIRHNLCNTVQSYIWEKFLHGQRCKRCNPRMSGKEFVGTVWHDSSGEYTVVGLHGDYATLLNTTTNEKVTLRRQLALQELRRPTQSDILPLEKRNPKPNTNGQSV